MTKDEQVPLSDKEIAEVRRLAKQLGISEDEAATAVVAREIARRMKKRSRPAKVYAIKHKT